MATKKAHSVQPHPVGSPMVIQANQSNISTKMGFKDKVEPLVLRHLQKQKGAPMWWQL